jgi:hypothetical protein
MGDWKEGLRRAKHLLGAPITPKKVAASRPPAATVSKVEVAQARTAETAGRSSQVAPAEPQQGAQVDPEPTGVLNLPRAMALTRQGEFREPPSWMGKGLKTQARDDVRGRAVEAFIGLDFGTAYTKAAVGLLDKVFPVDWDGIACTTARYLLPSEYSALPTGRCWLGQHPQANPGDLISGLKQDFISGAIDDAAIRRAAVFLALVLQYVRAWVYEHHGPKLGARPIRWHLNVGVPCDGFEDDRRRRAYQHLMRLSWSLSLSEAAKINYAAAQRLAVHADSSLPMDLTEADAVPEFVAQLAGYAQSAQRRNGLHALVDIGGGTVDMVTFNVHHMDGDDVFPFFVPRVEPLGTFGLIANRLRGSGAFQCAIDKPLSELTDVADFCAATGVSKEQAQLHDKSFFARVGSSFASVMLTTKQRRYRLAPEWREGVRTFVTGGGAHVPGYKAALANCSLPENVRLNWLDLPVHSKLDEFDAGAVDYQRISVACGLATNALSLGQVRPASEVDDDMPGQAMTRQRDRLSHEDLYPR